MTFAFVFPGQGSQRVGMGVALAEAFAVARETFEEIDDVLGQNLQRLMVEGPEEELTLTANAQPALMAVSIATMRVLRGEAGVSVDQAAFVAGHSLGEYSALAAADALTLADTTRLLRIRGEAMQDAVAPGEGAMAAILGLDIDVVQEVAEEAAQGEVCAAANDNAPGQVVVSGSAAAVARAIEIASTRGARRSVMLPVSAPFHCKLMEPAADKMAAALETVSLISPRRPLIANVTAQAVSDGATIKGLLVDQVTGMVRWRESVLAMRDLGVERIVEVGSGTVLTGLVRRIDRSLTGTAVGGPAEIEKLVASL